MEEDFFCSRSSFNPYEERHRDFREASYHSDDIIDEALSDLPKLGEHSNSKSIKKTGMLARTNASAIHLKSENGITYSLDADVMSGQTRQGTEQPLPMTSIPSPKNGYKTEPIQTAIQVSDE